MIRKSAKAVVLLFILLLLISLLTSCADNTTIPKEDELASEEKVNSPQEGGKVVIATTQAVNLDPLQAENEEEKAILSLIYDGLVKVDGEGKIQPALAQSIQISEDGRNYSFDLRREVTWHDGTVFTSKDVKATFDKIRKIKADKKTPAQWFQVFNNIESYDAPDDYSINISLYNADAGFLYHMDFGICPVSAVDLNDTKQNEKETETDIQANFSSFIGTGPFKFEKHDSQTLILSKNDKYYRGKPYLDQIEIKFFPDLYSMKEAFKSQSVDLIRIEAQDWGIFQNMANVTLLQYPSRYFEFMALNLKNQLFSDPKVRQAILMSIDREKILQDTSMGRGIVIEGPVLPYTWAYNSQIPHVTHNSEKAVQILNEAGWKDENEDGILERKNGSKIQNFEFELLVNTSNISRYQAANQIKKDLGEIGISVKLVDITWDELKNRVLKKNFDAALMGWELSPNTDLRFMFLTDEIKNGYNFVSYSNPDLDSLLIKAHTQSMEADRKLLLYQIQEIIAKDLPYIFLYSPYNLMAVNSRIKDMKPNAVNPFSNIGEWWVEQ